MEVDGQHHILAALPTGKGPGTPGTGGWVCLRASVEKSGKYCLHQGLNSGLSTYREALYRLHYPDC